MRDGGDHPVRCPLEDNVPAHAGAAHVEISSFIKKGSKSQFLREPGVSASYLSAFMASRRVVPLTSFVLSQRDIIFKMYISRTISRRRHVTYILYPLHV